VVDRRQDLIVSGGENVYPAEVEAALTAIGGVRAAAVVGVPDPEWGAVPAAAVVPQDGVRLDPEALTRALRRRLAAYKVPREWALVNELPLTANGKVRRQAVQAWFASRRERPR
jgi:acyl-CoA synthetase (AMP-forming)/AMP-acid ligase II